MKPFQIESIHRSQESNYRDTFFVPLDLISCTYSGQQTHQPSVWHPYEFLFLFFGQSFEQMPLGCFNSNRRTQNDYYKIKSCLNPLTAFLCLSMTLKHPSNVNQTSTHMFDFSRRRCKAVKKPSKNLLNRYWLISKNPWMKFKCYCVLLTKVNGRVMEEERESYIASTQQTFKVYIL